MHIPTHLTNIFPYWTHQFHTNPHKVSEVIQLKLNQNYAKMQMNIHCLINITVNDQLDLNLFDICLSKALQTSCKWLNTM